VSEWPIRVPWRHPRPSLADLVNAMNKLLSADEAFPAWLTMSWAWEQAMDDPDEVKAVIGRNLRRLREKCGLTQASLARRSQASLVAVKEIEAAKALPDIASIWKLAQALDVPCTALLDSARDASLSSKDLPQCADRSAA
jgi:ribosome-binding protein aMBF1 (putative translation factor)